MGEYVVDREVRRPEGKHYQTWDRVTFPNGSSMIYIEVPDDQTAYHHHTYWLRENPNGSPGGRLDSSSKLNVFAGDKSGLHNSRVYHASQGELDPWKQPRIDGDVVHRFLEALAKGDPLPRSANRSDRQEALIGSLLRWWELRRPEAIAVEQFVLHTAWGYAGHFDLLARIDGRKVRIDLKTGTLYPEHGAQLVSYELAAEWCGLETADDLMLLKVTDTGDFYEVPAFVTERDFLEAMRQRTLTSSIDSMMKAHVRDADASRALEDAA